MYKAVLNNNIVMTTRAKDFNAVKARINIILFTYRIVSMDVFNVDIFF